MTKEWINDIMGLSIQNLLVRTVGNDTGVNSNTANGLGDSMLGTGPIKFAHLIQNHFLVTSNS